VEGVEMVWEIGWVCFVWNGGEVGVGVRLRRAMRQGEMGEGKLASRPRSVAHVYRMGPATSSASLGIIRLI